MIQIPLTPGQFTALAAKVSAEQGIELTGNQGKLTKLGVTASYVYADSLLTITILEKPFFVTTEYCEEQLKKFMA